MSKETLDQFIQKVTDSEELQTRIGEEMDTDAFIALGAEHGCEFTAEDLAENVELSDEELDGVAGGHRQDQRITDSDSIPVCYGCYDARIQRSPRRLPTSGG